VLLARTSRRAVVWLVVTLGLGCAGRLIFVGAAYRLAYAGAQESVQLAVVGAGVFAALRAAQSFLRMNVQRDVYAMTSRAVLASDVLSVPTHDVRRVALDGTYHAVVLVAQQTPAFVSDILASLAILPLVVSTFESRLLVLAAIAMAVVTLVAALLRAVAQRLEQRSVDAYAGVIETLLGSIESRVEIVARAGEEGVGAAFDRQLADYAAVSRRSGFGAALLGRAPLAAGALAIVLVVAFDSTSRAALEGALLTKALLLAACLPALHGAALGLHGTLRSLVFVRPLIELLCAKPRGEGAGAHHVELPVPVRCRAVSFVYDAGSKPTLSDVSFEWNPEQPLVLTGPNGSGKSTLLRLLLGLRSSSSGTIMFGRHDLASIDVRALRRQIAYLPQRPYLGEAHGTVRAALRLTAPNASDEEMGVVLERTGVRDALREHAEDELSTPIGELSAGQRQRVALARVLLQDARMLLLDEPDANLDASGIRLVAMLVKDLSARKTMVAVAAHTQELAQLSASVFVELPARSAPESCCAK